jgi:SPP1 family predicted phage head-tail adaptor
MIGNTKPIKLLKYATTIDANGDATETIQTTYKMWAEVTDNGGGRSQGNGRTELSDNKIFKINFRDYNITSEYKIQYFGQTYAISNARRIDEKRFTWEITAFNIFELD